MQRFFTTYLVVHLVQPQKNEFQPKKVAVYCTCEVTLSPHLPPSSLDTGYLSLAQVLLAGGCIMQHKCIVQW